MILRERGKYRMYAEWRHVFPFVAVIGQDAVKNALLWNAVNPAVGGVLIRGEKGVAKSTLVRGLAAVLRGVDIVELPLGVTEDRLVGSLSFEHAIRDGEKRLEPGILERADGNLLYVDEVNLLGEDIAHCLLDASASQVNRVEREGISGAHHAAFQLVGTMNPEEGALGPQLLDRFGLCVEARGSRCVAERTEIIRRRLAFEQDPAAYLDRWAQETQRLSEKVAAARERLADVAVPEAIARLAAETAAAEGCAGHRAELAITQAARAIAALEGHQISDDDVRLAAAFALPHRRRQPAEQLPDAEGGKTAGSNAPRQDGNHPEAGESAEPPGRTQEARPQEQENPPPEPTGSGRTDAASDAAGGKPETVEQPDAGAGICPIQALFPGKTARAASGERGRNDTRGARGRYVRYKIPRGRIRDVALDATLRAAAPYEKQRRPRGLAVAVERQDIREKVRERRTGRAILFVVAASGSMGADRRMRAAKGAVLSLLGDAYRSRDRVGMIAFRKDGAELLLDFTGSVELAQKKLRVLPTGGKTPLAAGLALAYDTIRMSELRNPDWQPLLVLVTDGRANMPTQGGDPVEEAVRAAERLCGRGVPSLVIDTESGFIRLGLARRIAQAIGGEYRKLDELRKESVGSSVREFVACSGGMTR